MNNTNPFDEIVRRVRGRITAPIYTAVPGRLTVHGGELDFAAGGRWVTVSMISNDRVICYNGYGKVEICDTADVDEVIESVSRLYRATMTKSNFVTTVNVGDLHFLRLATPGENPEVTNGMGDVKMINGNLLLFANGNLNCAHPDTHSWYEATICHNGVICTTNTGAFKVCTTINELIQFLFFSINPQKLKELNHRVRMQMPIAACLEYCNR